MTFREKIDLFMEENKYENLKKLAIESKIPYTTLRDLYEKQNTDNSKLGTIQKLASFMGCSLDYLAYDKIIDDEISNNDFITADDELDQILFSKAKELTDDEKKAVLNVMNVIKKDIKKEIE